MLYDAWIRNAADLEECRNWVIITFQKHMTDDFTPQSMPYVHYILQVAADTCCKKTVDHNATSTGHVM